MVKEIDTNNIRKITFGIMNKYIDVTDMILKKLNNGQTINLTINIFPIDPYVGKVKRLIIYYESGFNMIVNENDSIVKKYDTINIIKKNNVNYLPTGLNYIISTNARDEHNIVEWIMYHLMIGFDYIVIIDHKSTDPIQKIVDNYEWKNKVYVIRREDEGAVKLLFLNKIIIPFMMKRCKKYFIHLDADEYFYLNKKHTLTSFTDMIKGDIIAINWLMFGNNNIDRNTNKYNCLIPIYTKSANKLNKHFKLLIRVDIKNPIKFNNPHTIEYVTRKKTIYHNVLGQVIKGNNVYELMNNNNINDINNVPSYINHYYVQSKEDYIKRKIDRERDDAFKKRTFDPNIFNMDNDINNHNLLNYGNEIIKKLESYENNKLLQNNNSFGFIMARYVKCSETNKSWIRCYESIRKFYNEPIIIIDDNSVNEYITNHPTVNCKIIEGEFPQRGELLPYYYYVKYKFFNRAIIVHDSMEFKKYYNFKNITNYKNFTRLFQFGGGAYNIDVEHFEEMSKYVNNSNNILEYHNNNKLNLIGCFGVCYIIDYSYLDEIDKKYNIFNLIKYIDTRKKRQCLERFLSCLFEYDKGKRFITRPDLFGSIFSNKGEYIKKYFFGR